jgi:hypothetical protein
VYANRNPDLMWQHPCQILDEYARGRTENKDICLEIGRFLKKSRTESWLEAVVAEHHAEIAARPVMNSRWLSAAADNAGLPNAAHFTDKRVTPLVIDGVDRCYDPCPPGTLGTPPDKCRCPDDHDWDAASATCKERPKCTGGMVGTPPNCQCPAKTVLQDGTCQKCTKGRVAKDGQCQCPSGQVFVKADDKCQPCEGDQEVIKGFCQCRSGTIEFPSNSARCVKSLGLTCQWRGEAPFCDGECERGEVQYDRGTERSHVLHQENRHTFGKPCATGLKVYCCRPQ